MADLDFPTSPSDGDVYEGYVYNSTKGVWQWQVLSPSLVSLTDTDISSPSSGEVLEYDGTNWVNAAGAVGGKILQFVSVADDTTVTTSSTPLTLLTLNITPSSASNKILLLSTVDMDVTAGGINRIGVIKILKGGSEIARATFGDDENSDKAYGTPTIIYLDSPGTTSSVTYTLTATRGSSGTDAIGTRGGGYGITAMEVAG